MPKSPDLILITGSKGTKPCAVAEIAALEFEPLLSGLSQKQRLRRVRELVDVVGAAAAVASVLMLEIVIAVAMTGQSPTALRDVGVLGLAVCLTGVRQQHLVLRN